MNTIKILLIIGLVYFAFTQKSLKIRNMLLVVTGLLTFCMFSLEGFSVKKDDFETVFGKADNPEGKNKEVTTNENKMTVKGSDMNIFTFSTDVDLDENNVTCKINGTTEGNVSLKDTVKDTITEATDISSLLNCKHLTKKKQCGLAEGEKLKCPIYNELQKSKFCNGDECTEGEFVYGGTCCKAPCSKDKCEWGLFGGSFGNGGKKCDDAAYGLFPWFYEKRCEKDENDDDDDDDDDDDE